MWKLYHKRYRLIKNNKSPWECRRVDLKGALKRDGCIYIKKKKSN